MVVFLLFPLKQKWGTYRKACPYGIETIVEVDVTIPWCVSSGDQIGGDVPTGFPRTQLGSRNLLLVCDQREANGKPTFLLGLSSETANPLRK